MTINDTSIYLAKVVLLVAAVFSVATVLSSVKQNISIKRETEEKTGLYKWILDEPNGLSLELTQRAPEDTNAFYVSRGFNSSLVNQYSSSCIFHAKIANNSANRKYSIDLQKWKVITANGDPRPLKASSEWQELWEKNEVPLPARIAFRLSQFPTVQQPGPGDWFQGRVSMNLVAEDQFDLLIYWEDNEESRDYLIKGLICPPHRSEGNNE